MSLYNLHYLEFMATSHDKFWSHPRMKTARRPPVRPRAQVPEESAKE